MSLCSTPTDPALFAGSVFFLGLVVGSFLNVVIYRLPIMLERDWRVPGGRGARQHRRGRGTRHAAAERFNLAHPPLRLPELQGAHQGRGRTFQSSAG